MAAPLRQKFVDRRRWIVVAFCVLVVGCRGGNSGTLEGTVMLDGAPLKDGMIVFQPMAASGGGSSAGGRIVDGKFSIPTDQRVVPGKFRVEITAVRKTGRQTKGMAGEMVDELQHVVPRRYSQQSELTADIAAGGPNHFEFALVSR